MENFVRSVAIVALATAATLIFNTAGAEVIYQLTNNSSVQNGFTLSGSITTNSKALAMHKGRLWLGGKTISPKVAMALATHTDTISPDSLEEISPEAAKALAKHKSRLELNGLKEITPAIAKALAKHDGMLVFNKLETLTDEEARTLLTHKGDLSFNGLTTLSDKAAESLRANPKISLPEQFRSPRR